MPDYLRSMIEKAKQVNMTPKQREEQRRSFAYGNTKIENDQITRESVDREADAMAEDDGKKDGNA